MQRRHRRRLAVDLVVRLHDPLRLGHADRVLERRGVVLAQVALVEVRRAGVAVGLVVVGEPVLQRRRRQQVLRVVAVQPGDVALRQLADQVRILTRRFLGAPPARIAAEIDQRRAQDDADAAPLRVHAAQGVVHARLVSRRVADELHRVGIPRLGQAERLRELRADQVKNVASTVARPADAVQPLGEGREALDAEAVDRELVLAHQAQLFVGRHLRQEIVDPLLDRGAGILKAILIIRRIAGACGRGGRSRAARPLAQRQPAGAALAATAAATAAATPE